MVMNATGWSVGIRDRYGTLPDLGSVMGRGGGAGGKTGMSESAQPTGGGAWEADGAAGAARTGPGLAAGLGEAAGPCGMAFAPPRPAEQPVAGSRATAATRARTRRFKITLTTVATPAKRAAQANRHGTRSGLVRHRKTSLGLFTVNKL
ncbi:hypothetical protein Adi01nite_18650 [Amorphoplanes digitatis]|nr:hypothetical protein Adi01nite_18650 [Actinoplanes digitatis]